MSNQLKRDDVHNFLLPYRSRVYDPFELIADIRTTFDRWEKNGTSKHKITFHLSDQFDDGRKVYGVSDEMMEILGAWRSPMPGKNLWVNPLNPDSRLYSDIYVVCPDCDADFGGTRHHNRHIPTCESSKKPRVIGDDLERTLNNLRCEWLQRAGTFGLDIDVAARRLGWAPQTARDFIWEDDSLSYESLKREGKIKMATTWDIALNWGTDIDMIARSHSISPSTVRAYISRFSNLDEVPRDVTKKRR